MRAERLGQGAADDRHDRPGLARVPGLDGLRAVAVLGVLAFHFGVRGIVGGYLGVDAFFVLSGYLITALLLDEWRRTGAIGLSGFWARRARRLLPALLLLLVVVIAYAAFFAGDATLGGLRKDVLSTLAYVANWRFIGSHVSYFDQFNAPSPVQHLWSLAVEEQFYVVWPIVALVILRWMRSVQVLRWVAVAGTAGSVFLMSRLYHPGTDPSRVYFGTDTKAQVILVGVILATLAPSQAWSSSSARRWLLIGSASVGLLVIAWTWTHVDGQSSFLYRGGTLVHAVAVATLIASSVALPASGVSRLLSQKPLAYVGRISYGVYLWHWPVFLVLTHAHTGLGRLALLIIRFAATFAIAIASSSLVELPFRRGRFAFPKPLARVLAPAALVVTALAVVIATTAPSHKASAADTALLRRTIATGVAQRAHLRQTNAPHVLLVGDSVALTLSFGLGSALERAGMRFESHATPGCGMARGNPVRFAGQVRDDSPFCRQGAAEVWRPYVDSIRPAVVVVLEGLWEVVDRRHDGQWMHLGEPVFDRFLERQLDESLDALTSRGAAVALVTAPYYSTRERPDGGAWPESDPMRVNRWNALLREVAARHGRRVRVIDVNRLLSPHGTYARVVRGRVVRSEEGIHLTVAGASLVGDFLAPRLVELAHLDARSAAFSSSTTSKMTVTTQ